MKKKLAVFLSLAVMISFIPCNVCISYGAVKVPAPKIKAVKAISETSVKISWGKVSKAKGYVVYMKAPGEKYTKIKTTSKRTVTEKNLMDNSKYSFKLKAYKKKNGKKIYSKYSKVKTVTTKAYSSEAEKMAVEMSKHSKAAMEYADQVGSVLAYDMDLADDATGFRTAGSDAEKKAADYLVKEFKSIGLEDVHKEAVTLDKWQFNDAKISIEYGKNRNILDITNEDQKVISYASPGTVQSNKPDSFWENMPIIDMGMGFKDDYDAYYDKNQLKDSDRNMEGAIVLVAVDQWNETWIDGPYNEAYHQGAAAIITYQCDGYGQYDDDTINVQDLCCSNLGIPCLSISPNTAKKIQDALDKDPAAKADLFVDNEVNDEEGTGYNVIGKIPGSGNTGQQILYAAHYDKYFYGFEDDCIAIGLVAGIAKDMIDSGFKPVNDIYFIAHCAEEWGEFDTSTDWAIGSWENITKNHPEWQGTTLALMNYELPAIDNFKDHGILRSNAEMGEVTKGYLNSKMSKHFDNFYSKGWQILNDDQMTQTDVICFAENGVPSIMPRQDDRTTWTKNRYHTPWDNDVEKKTADDGVYSKALLKTDIDTFATLGAYIDDQPALELDFGSRCEQLEEAIEGSEKYVASGKIEEYKDALSKLEAASAKFATEAKTINASYIEALAAGDQAAVDKARADGKAYNAKALAAFKKSQEELMGLADYDTVAVFHKAIQDNLDIYQSIFDALEDGDVSEDDIWIASELFGYTEYYAYIFSEDTYKLSIDVLNNTKIAEKGDTNWGDEMLKVPAQSMPITAAMYELWNAEEEANEAHNAANYAEYLEGYENIMASMISDMEKDIDKEIAGMNAMINIMK